MLPAYIYPRVFKYLPVHIMITGKSQSLIWCCCIYLQFAMSCCSKTFVQVFIYTSPWNHSVLLGNIMITGKSQALIWDCSACSFQSHAATNSLSKYLSTPRYGITRAALQGKCSQQPAWQSLTGVQKYSDIHNVGIQLLTHMHTIIQHNVYSAWYIDSSVHVYVSITIYNYEHKCIHSYIRHYDLLVHQ